MSCGRLQAIRAGLSELGLGLALAGVLGAVGVATAQMPETSTARSRQAGPGQAGLAQAGPEQAGLAQAGLAQAGPEQAEEPQVATPMPVYDEAIFQAPIPADQLAFMKQFVGGPSKALYHDKQFHKLLHGVIAPGWEFHYGRDMSLPDALDMVMDGSKVPVEMRGGRYVVLGGAQGPYLLGRGMVWIDLQEGVALGAFYFHPTNGEPTPSVTVFSKQIHEDTLSMDRLPPAFGVDLRHWQAEAGVPEIATRYFIGGEKKRILLEHDEDFCSYLNGPSEPPPAGCEQMNADAADVDMNTAYYLDQVHYATNATAWMITGADETAFLALRSSRCGGVADVLGCRIRLTRAQVHRVGGLRPGGGRRR